jgi:hypothetical protein
LAAHDGGGGAQWGLDHEARINALGRFRE